ncbi:ankyrin repeat domain-containing protein [Phormidesmis priestleyi]
MQPEQILQQRYQLEKLLGQNNGRETWLASDLAPQPHEKVVVKLLAQNLQWQDIQLLEREATVLKNLQHPRIPRYRDAFSLDSQNDQGHWFGLVQTYVPGVTLRSLLDHHHCLTEKQAQKIAIQVLQILITLHELNPPVLHRDIKPSNLLLGDDKQIYLIDFGTVQNRAKRERSTMTVVGTYGYTSLEQYRGQTVPASDLFALGTSFVHLLTGVDPSDLPKKQLCIQFADDEGNLIGNHAPISPKFRRWLEMMIQPAVENRFGSARQALEALQTGRINPIETIPQPVGSRIHLQALPQELIIKIPALAPSKMTIVLSLLGVLTLGVMLAVPTMLFLGSEIRFRYNFEPLFIFAGTLWLAWLVMAFSCLKAIYTYTKYQKVRIDQTQFLLEWRSWRGRSRRQQGRVKDIQEVKQSVQSAPVRSLRLKTGKTELEMVTIATAKQPYNLAIGLTATECTWLTQEINNWLQDPPTDDSPVQPTQKLPTAAKSIETVQPPKQRIYQQAQGQAKMQQERKDGNDRSHQPTPERQSLAARFLLFLVAAMFQGEPVQSQTQIQQEWEDGDNPPTPPKRHSIIVNAVIFLLLFVVGIIATFWSEPFLNFVQESPQLSFLHPKPTPPRVVRPTPQLSLRPLQRAARYGDLQQVNKLIKAGANVKGEEGTEAFFQAALFDHINVMQLLLQKGVNPNAESSSLLLRQVMRQNKAIAVKLLLKAGANPNATDFNTDSILFESLLGNPYTSFLSWDSRLNMFPIIGETRIEVVRALIESGADPKARDPSNGTNVLMIASAQGHTDLVQLLIQKGANVNSPNAYGETSLMFASRRGSIAVAKVLLENKAKVNVPDPNPYHRHTALMYAVKSRSIEVVKLLLEKGADVNTFTSKRNYDSKQIPYIHRTVLDHALEIGDPNMIALLKKSGAKSYSQLPRQ